MTGKSHAVAAPAPINTPSLRKENQKKDGNVSNPSSGHLGWGVKSEKEEVNVEEKEIHAKKNGLYQQSNGKVSSLNTVIPNANKSWSDLDDSPTQQTTQREEISSRSTQSVQSESSFSPTLCKQMSIMNITNWCDDPFEEDTANFRPQVEMVTEDDNGPKRASSVNGLHEEDVHNANRAHGIIPDHAQQAETIISDSGHEPRRYPDLNSTSWRSNQLSDSTLSPKAGIPPRPRQNRSDYTEGLGRSDGGSSFWAQNHRHRPISQQLSSAEYDGHMNRRTDYNEQSHYYGQAPTNNGYSRQDLRSEMLDPPTYRASHSHNVAKEDPTASSAAFVTPPSTFETASADSPTAYVKRVYSRHYPDRDKGASQGDKTWRSNSTFHSSNPYASPWTIRNENREYPREQHLSRPPVSELNLKSTQSPNEFASPTYASREFGSNAVPAEHEKRVQILKRSESKMLYDHKTDTMIAVNPNESGPKVAIYPATRRAKPSSFAAKANQNEVISTKEREADATKSKKYTPLAKNTQRTNGIKIDASSQNSILVKAKSKKPILTYRPISSACNITKAAQILEAGKGTSEADKQSVNANITVVSENTHEMVRPVSSEAVDSETKDEKAVGQTEKRLKSRKIIHASRLQATRRKVGKVDKRETFHTPKVHKKRSTRMSMQKTVEDEKSASAPLDSIRPKNRHRVDVDLLKQIPEGGGVVVLTDGQHGIDYSSDGIGEFETVKSRRTIHLERKMRREVARKPINEGRSKRDGGIVINVRTNSTRRVKRRGIPVSVQAESKQSKCLGTENTDTSEKHQMAKSTPSEEGFQRRTLLGVHKAEPLEKFESGNGSRVRKTFKTNTEVINKVKFGSADRERKSVELEKCARTSKKPSSEKTKKDRWKQKEVNPTSMDNRTTSHRRKKEVLQKLPTKEEASIKKAESDQNGSKASLQNTRPHRVSNRADSSRRPAAESKDRLPKSHLHEAPTKSTLKAALSSSSDHTGTPPPTKLEEHANTRVESRYRDPKKQVKRVYLAKVKP
uniref:AlNc14C39G3359 protein n=1 Tax=Albugo laibachii Nc14 TaxID=890382 RepID=F0W992_9STRA|nr:AlNc14C39G3359 [Albugo laibachii Nc14]CCA18351.1 AlNc14C49G3884 [Albugo laibachii Nc14]|eukprot:CCA18351.1 AlNc14C49G3884 [Albugo laibachii Nc14]